MKRMILVFVDGELIHQLVYKTKSDAKRNYIYFKKHGMPDPYTGETIKNAIFELI